MNTNENYRICKCAKYAPSGALICNCAMCINGRCPVAATMDEVADEGDFPNM